MFTGPPGLACMVCSDGDLAIYGPHTPAPGDRDVHGIIFHYPSHLPIEYTIGNPVDSRVRWYHINIDIQVKQKHLVTMAKLIKYFLTDTDNNYAGIIEEILNDHRGWNGLGYMFERTSCEAETDVFIEFMSNTNIHSQFGDDFNGLSLCKMTNPGYIYINQENWDDPPTVFQVPAHTTDRETTYHQYIIQHEMGHFLGNLHMKSNPNQPCPVMYQQTRGTGGSEECTANPWPTISNETISGGGPPKDTRVLRLPIWGPRHVPTQMFRAQADLVMRVLKARYEQLYNTRT